LGPRKIYSKPSKRTFQPRRRLLAPFLSRCRCRRGEESAASRAIGEVAITGLEGVHLLSGSFQAVMLDIADILDTSKQGFPFLFPGLEPGMSLALSKENHDMRRDHGLPSF
jgi:hypothetical protein